MTKFLTDYLISITGTPPHLMYTPSDQASYGSWEAVSIPFHPLARADWLLTEYIKQQRANGLDDRTILGRVDYALDCEIDR